MPLGWVHGWPGTQAELDGYGCAERTVGLWRMWASVCSQDDVNLRQLEATYARAMAEWVGISPTTYWLDGPGQVASFFTFTTVTSAKWEPQYLPHVGIFI